MSIVNCAACGLPHVPDSGRNAVCLPCWKQERGYDLTKSDLAHTRLQAAFATGANAASSNSGYSEADRQKHLKEIADLKVRLSHQEKASSVTINGLNMVISELRARAASTPTGSFTQDVLMKIIALCHPDKHDNSPSSTEITKLLLSMRKR